MAEKNLYKVIALIVAIFTYLFFAFSLIVAFNDDKEIKDYGFDVEEAVVVNIDSLIKDKPKPIEQSKPKPIQEKIKPVVLPPIPEPIIEEKEKKVEKESREKEAKSAKDLFSTVRTDNYKKVMQERVKQEEAKASRLQKQKAEAIKKADEKKQREKQKKNEAQEAQKLVEQMQISTPSEHKKSGEKHEFWSFVSSKIMAKWERTISTENGLSATVTIIINNKGELRYKDLMLSGNSLFDTKLKVFLDNLEYEKFPSYKQGSYIEAEFEFTDKEK